VVRSTDGHFIHANVDTDVLVSEEFDYGSTRKPEEMYELIERFCLGRRRIELFGEVPQATHASFDQLANVPTLVQMHNIRRGWVTLGNAMPGTNYSARRLCALFTVLTRCSCSLRSDGDVSEAL